MFGVPLPEPFPVRPGMAGLPIGLAASLSSAPAEKETRRRNLGRFKAIIAHPAKNVRLAKSSLPAVQHRLIPVRRIGIASGQFGYR